MSATLPPLNLAATCPKCGEGEIRLYWTDGTRYDCRRMDPDCYGAEHIHRTCPRCQYRWPEDILREPEPRVALTWRFDDDNNPDAQRICTNCGAAVTMLGDKWICSGCKRWCDR